MLFAFSGRATRNFLTLVVVMHFILFVDRVNLAAAASVMQHDLGLSNIALGIAFSAFNYAYAPFQLIGGWFADRFGARRTLTVCGVTWSITTIATGAVTGLVSLFAVRLVLGMGEGATLPAVTRALSKWTSLAARGTAVGITHAAGRLGAGASAPIVALLITWFSWRFSFVALGVVSALWAAAWWWFFYEDPRRHPRITSAELAALPAVDPTGETGSGPVPWRRLVPRVAPLMIVYFCQGWTGWLFVTWMPSLLQKNYGLDLKKSSFLYAAMLFCAMIAEFLGGVLTDYLLRRTGNLQIARSRLIAGSWLLVVAGLVPAIFVHDLVVGLTGFTVACAAMDGDDGHCAELCGLFERADECRWCRRRHSVTGRLRLATRPHRQLDDAVRLLGRAAAVRNCHDLVDPSRPPDRGCPKPRQVGGGRGVD